jgi:signal transduction histidine kinase
VLEEVRVIAHGIYPAILTDAGLGPAVDSIADVAALPVEIAGCPARRYPAPVEAAAYQVVSEAKVQEVGGLVELVDRVGAIDGTISIESDAASGTTIGAAIPCAW